VALVCLGLETQGPFRVARFLGGKESNLNLGLFRPGTTLTRADLETLLRQAAAALGPARPDVFVLQYQPLEWLRTTNPFALLPHQDSPNFTYAAKLDPDAEKFFASKFSKDGWKKLRRKEARMAALGPIAFITNDTPAHADTILDAFFQQKIARCREQGIDSDFAEPAMRNFLEILTRPSGDTAPCLEFSALAIGERITATFAGGEHGGSFTGTVNSYDADIEITKTSPGQLLLLRLIKSLCETGIENLDFGIGEASYKSQYCDLTVPLFDTILPISFKGRLFAFYEASRLRFKGVIKGNRRLFDLLRRLQRLLRGGSHN
jgi:CelD/BcsL family acetyltransferase involved in cellulose biosynthesis